MRAQKLSRIALAFSLAVNAAAQTETVLFSLTGGLDGKNPRSGVIFDPQGNLYGTSQFGGDVTDCQIGCGTIWELSPATGGGWTETVLHSFTGADGANPFAELVRDAA